MTMKIKKFLLKEGLSVILLALTVGALAMAAMTPQERAGAYYSQGYLYYAERSYLRAVAEYDKAVALDPAMAKAYYWRGKSHFALGQYDKATADIDKAISLRPDIDDGEAFKAKIARAYSPAPKPAPVPDPNPVPLPKPIPAPAPAPKPVPAPEPKEPRISMDLHAVEISQAFNLLAKETGQNIVVSKDVHGRISLSLNNVTTREAFDAILKAGHCTYLEEGPIIRIIPTGKPKRTQYLPGGMINKTFTMNYVKADDAAATLKSLLSEDTKVITTAGSNYLVVEGFEDAIEKAEAIIDNLDTPPDQVMVEARIIELSQSDTASLGINLKRTNPENPTDVAQTKGLAAPPTSTTAAGLYYAVTDQDMEGLLESLQSKTGYNLLSSPKVMALNAKEAEIITGQKLGYKVKTITETGMIESVEFLDVGTKLVFTPFIKDNGMVLMEIHPEISEGSIVNDLPQKKSTETTTQLLVKDGDTIVIGGLMKDSSQKMNKGVPFLSDIPIIGVPFRRVEIITERREIMVLISPKIVTEEFRKGLLPSAEKFEKKRQEQRYEAPLDLIL